MARSRNIKPGFFRDAKVVACSFQARLLFAGLWCMADYMGRLKYVPLEIKMELFPADEIDIEKCMTELSENGLIQIYREDSGSTLVQVTNFTRHQNPHVNERQDKDRKPLPCLPGPDESKIVESKKEEEKPSIEQRVKDALVVLREYSESDRADSLNLIPDSLNLIPEIAPPSPPAGGKKKRKTQLPKDFDLNDHRQNLAIKFWQSKNRLDLVDRMGEIWDQFINHVKANAKTYADWDAAWTTWYTNAIKYERPQNGNNQQRYQSSEDRFEQARIKWEREHGIS